MREGEGGPADPVDAFKSGPPVGGTILSTGGGFLPADLFGKGDEVANLVGSLTGKRVERPSLLRGNAESSFTLDLGASVSAFPHLKTDRNRMAGRWRSRTPSLIGATRRAAVSLLRFAYDAHSRCHSFVWLRRDRDNSFIPFLHEGD